ncbi:MAG: hypothetical protein ACK57B_09860 [Betaproteobacteria bacterium]|jgi:hypothetical protein
MTQLLDRIESRLSIERDEFVRAELLGTKASYLGRIGRSDEAREIIRAIRQTFNDGRSGRVTCLILVAEGVIQYHAFKNQAALDKFSRALLLAEATKHPDLIGICAAWKAFIDFDLSRFESMQRSLLLVRDLGLERDHAVQSRVAVTLMTGSILLGRQDAARKWFHHGHQHAVSEGDLACIDGLLFNRAVFGLARQRVAWSLSAIDPQLCATIRAELQSARNLQNMVGITTMRGHIDLCVARLDLMEGNANAAIEALARIVEIDQFAGKHLNSTALAIDRLYAMVTASREVDVAAEISALDVSALETLDPDERLVAMTMLVRLSDRLAGAIDATVLRTRLEDAKSDYEEFEKRLLAAVSSWL